MASVVSQSYSDAIYMLGKEENKLDLFKEQLVFVLTQMQEHKDFMRLLTHPKLHKEEKKKMVDEVFETTIDHTLCNFLKLLIDKSRFLHLQDIQKEFVKRYNVEHGIVIAHITSAKELSKDEVKRLQDMLAKKLEKQVEIQLSIDGDLIAGLRIKIGDTLLDHTAKNRLNSLKELANQSGIQYE